jgi:VIT1/CCC1 family predicted Fe2+/Mn2+ transporter
MCGNTDAKADRIGESIRIYLISAHTGGLAAVILYLNEPDRHAGPCLLAGALLFLLGLVLTGVQLFVAKDRALNPPTEEIAKGFLAQLSNPHTNTWWSVLSFLFFIIGAILTLATYAT